MKIHEKLDILMKITNTQNSVLGKYLSFDTSYISRIRSGKRRIPKNHPFLEPTACFAAQRITEPYQKRILGEFICFGTDWPESPEAVQRLLYSWLSQDDDSDLPVGRMLSGLSAIQPSMLPNLEMPTAQNGTGDGTTQFFFGNEGKRRAVSLFLSELCSMEKPPQLLLYSNEDFSWMYEDQAFAHKWAMLLFQYIRKGGHIRIAHTISRASGEMLMALQKWIPIYMTGAIEPYYYPKILDRVFRKTLFIAEGHSAIMASSVGEHTENALNCMTHDAGAVRALEEEYWQFFNSCKPLMQIFNLSRVEQFLVTLKHFNEIEADMITVRTTPSFYTMPAAVDRSMSSRLDSSWLTKRRQFSNETFEKMMENHRPLTEILNLPPVEQVLSGKLRFPMCDLFDKPGLEYTPQEFILHLESMIEKLKLYDEYNAILSDAIPANELVYVKEDAGVILVKSDLPTIAFAISEQRMVSAFWDYLSELTENSRPKEKVIAQLEKYLQKLENGLKD